ncbi:acyltransferase [Nonomuraea sp. NPDC005650]|uniref:acyltransferase family protein n=1 Tax=Nonomuraea sp. NPDC005650 TaxID=3157045 RepID=UPI0033AA16FE
MREPARMDAPVRTGLRRILAPLRDLVRWIVHVIAPRRRRTVGPPRDLVRRAGRATTSGKRRAIAPLRDLALRADRAGAGVPVRSRVLARRADRATLPERSRVPVRRVGRTITAGRSRVPVRRVGRTTAAGRSHVPVRRAGHTATAARRRTPIWRAGRAAAGGRRRAFVRRARRVGTAGRRRVLAALRDLVRRVERDTPPDRDRAIDALRALAIGGVVFGHWLVTALVLDSGAVRVASPLRYLPQLAPATWLFQTLAVFFLVGGYAAARSRRTSDMTYRQWLGARMARLFRPVAVVLAVWSVTTAGMLAAGADTVTVGVLVKLVLSPMWFLLVFAVLTAATPLVARLHPLWPLALVAAVDLVRYGLGGLPWSGLVNVLAGWSTPDGPDGSSWLGPVNVVAEWLGSWRLGYVNVLAGWLVPYCLGAAWARGALRSRTAGWVLLVGGTAGAVGLVLGAGYPAAMVGVPGAAVSNLDPPTLAAVSFGLAQCGAALLLLGPLRRALRRPVVWAAVALVNLSAMTVFLWHQSAMILVTAVGLLAGGALPGLHTVPDGPEWVLARLGWLPVFGVALAVCWAAFRAPERARSGRKPVLGRVPCSPSGRDPGGNGWRTRNP